jgi:putative DNA primase/helicase
MTHHVGILKNLVTEPEIWINPKNVGARSEANHANLVFLSNELQPLKIGVRDRRYMVIRTPNERDEAFYKAVGAEAHAGGAAALFHYLLEDVDLDGFTEHTKPLMTEAKEQLIEIGLVPSQLFWKELKQGILGLPYVPALSTDLYKAYTTWCLRNGFRMPEGINKFKPNFMSMNGVSAKTDRVPDPGIKVTDEKNLRQRAIILMGEREPDQQREKLRIVQGIAEFRQCLRDYLGEDRVYATGPRWEREGDAA